MEASIEQARVLHSTGQLMAAEEAYRQLLEYFGDQSKVLQPLSQICYQRGNLSDAIEFLKRLCNADDKNPDNYFSLAGVCKIAARTDEAIDCYLKALQLKPDFVDARVNLGIIYYEKQDYESSVACYETALQSKPEDIKGLYNLSLSLVLTGHVEKAVDNLQKVLSLQPDSHIAHSNYLFNLHYLNKITSKELHDVHEEWGKHHAKALYPESPPAMPDIKNGQAIRVGYVSPDLHKHSVAYFISSILEGHDRSRVESFCYSDALRKDHITEFLKDLSDNWHDCSVWNDAQVVQQIRKDKIDILVDLAGHSARNRLLVFAQKPAPVQVTYLGYPDITGMKSVDYRITDLWADPLEKNESYDSEKLVRLSSGFLCYNPLHIVAETSELPALKSDEITFGSFNNLPKINAGVIAVWAQILKAIPTAKLILKTRGLGDKLGRNLIYEGFTQHGIDSERIECIGYVPGIDAHLDLYSRVDIALDTFPYNGTTTTCEAMWMGVPVVTLSGQWHAARVGASLLSAVQLDDYIVYSVEDYVACAVEKTEDLKGLAKIRQDLRSTMASSRLMDKKGFVNELETIFFEMISK